MHIPDGFLSPPVWLTFDAISIPVVVWIAKRPAATQQPNRAPLLGVMGAFVFAAQMINFPVGSGASSHLLGGALLTAVLGPYAAVMVMTAVLALQAILFQDGGVLVLGANVFNMAIAGVAAAWVPLQVSCGSVALFLSGALSVLLSAALLLGQLAMSGVPIQGRALWIAAGLFGITALLEGCLTTVSVRAIGRLTAPPAPAPVPKPVLAAALLLATAGIWIASTSPDVLERFAAQAGLKDHPIWTAAPIPDYRVPQLGSGWMAQSVAGIAGIACVYAVCAFRVKRR